MSQSKLTSEQYQLLVKIASGLRNCLLTGKDYNASIGIWGPNEYAYWARPDDGSSLDRVLTEKGKQALAEWPR